MGGGWGGLWVPLNHCHKVLIKQWQHQKKRGGSPGIKQPMLLGNHRFHHQQPSSGGVISLLSTLAKHQKNCVSNIKWCEHWKTPWALNGSSAHTHPPLEWHKTRTSTGHNLKTCYLQMSSQLIFLSHRHKRWLNTWSHIEVSKYMYQTICYIKSDQFTLWFLC